MKRFLVRLLLALVALAVFRIGVPLALAAWHYSSTPTMREWVRERPVVDAVWDQPTGAIQELERRTLVRGEPDDGPERFGVWGTSFLFEHGDEVLLNLDLEVRFEASEVPGWLENDLVSERIDGVSVVATSSSLDPDFHAVCVLTLAQERPWKTFEPGAALDVFLLAGPGEVELITRQGERAPYALRDSVDMRSFRMGFVRGLILGWAHPSGGPPDVGIAHHAHAQFRPTWTRVEGGSQGGSLGDIELRTTTGQYSIHVHVESSNTAPFEHGATQTRTSDLSVLYSMNGQDW